MYQCEHAPGIQDGELPLRDPGVEDYGSLRAPDHEQVAHLEDSKDDKLEEGGGGKGVEERVDHDACSDGN